MGWNCAGSSCDSYGRGFMTRAEKVEMLQEYQKIDAPPHSKECGLNGARFLDAQSVHTLKGVVLDQTL